jgi:tetratricopeptide (TPR) repeat protein
MAGTAWQAIRAERARAEAIQNADTAVQVANDLSSFADKIAFFGLQATISDTERKKVIDSNLVSYKRLLELQPENAEIQASVGRMHRYRANLCRGLDETAEAEKSYTEAMGHYSTLAQKYPEDKRFKQSQAEIARDFAMLLKRIGRLKQASSLLQDSVREYEKLQIAESSSTDIQRVQANILIDQADLEYELGRFVDSERTARKAIAIYVRLIDTPRSHPDVLEPLFQSMAENRLAMCLREQGRIDEALVAHSEAVGRSMTLIKTNPSRDFLAFSYRNRAERAYTLSRIPDQRQTAWDEFSESIAGCAKLSKQFPDFSFYRHGQAQSTLWRARLNLLMDRKDDAIKDLATAADILGELMVKYPTIVDYRLDAGLTSLAQAELAATPEEANPFYRKAREAIEECVTRNPESESCRKALDQLNRPPNKP